MRVDRWEVLLAELLDEGLKTPFEWGVHDCAVWSFDVRAKLRGEASAADAWRGQYRSAGGGYRVMRKLGWDSYEDVARALCGAPLPTVRLAQRGDLVLAAGGVGFGIVAGGFVAGIGEHGVTSAPLASCMLAWRT